MSTAVLIPESGIMPDQQAKIDALKGLGKGLAAGVDTVMLNKALREMKDIGEGEDPHDKYIRTMAKYEPVLGEKTKYLEHYDPMKRLERQEAVRETSKGRTEDIKKIAVPKIERQLGKEFEKLDEKKQEKILNGIWDEKILQKIEKKTMGMDPQNAGNAFFENPEIKQRIDLERRKLEHGSERGLISSWFGDRFKPSAAKEPIESIIRDSREAYGEDSGRFSDIVRETLGVSSHMGDLFIVEEAYGKVADLKGLPRKFSGKGIGDWIVKNKNQNNPMQAKAAIIDRYRRTPHARNLNSITDKLIHKMYPGETTQVANSRDITP